MDLKETEHEEVKYIQVVKSRALHLDNKNFMSQRNEEIPLTQCINYHLLVKNTVAWG
jgi:hypothetical protein